MRNDLDSLAGWTAQNAVRRLDAQNREMSAQKWAAGASVYGENRALAQSTDAHAGLAMTAEYPWKQDPQTLEVKFRPIVAYPGILVAPYIDRGIVPGPKRHLWLVMRWRLEFVLIKNYYPANADVPKHDQFGWSGKILQAEARLEWSEKDLRNEENASHKQKVFNQHPGQLVEVWHTRLGRTDDQGVFIEDTAGAFFNLAGVYYIP